MNIMAQLREIFLPRDFQTAGEIADYITRSINYDAKTESPNQAKLLLLFQTSEQRTWLVATPQRLYCILDDNRKPAPHINWSISRSKIYQDGNFVLNLDAGEDRDERTGCLNFGVYNDTDRAITYTGWFYSKDFFRDKPVVEAVKEFINGVMQKSDSQAA